MKFRAHDTFFIRKGWLSKGMKAVHSKPDVFVSKDENPMDVLGIGSNMVKSLRYWLVATNLTEEALQNKRRIQKFTEFGNQVFKNDCFMEEYGTLYLLHYMLAKNEEDATSWYFFFKSFNRFLIISLDVLICRYSPLFRAFPALFISEEPHKSFYYPLCFRSQK